MDKKTMIIVGSVAAVCTIGAGAFGYIRGKKKGSIQKEQFMKEVKEAVSDGIKDAEARIK